MGHCGQWFGEAGAADVTVDVEAWLDSQSSGAVTIAVAAAA
jgi:hypothetical protein